MNCDSWSTNPKWTRFMKSLGERSNRPKTPIRSKNWRSAIMSSQLMKMIEGSPRCIKYSWMQFNSSSGSNEKRKTAISESDHDIGKHQYSQRLPQYPRRSPRSRKVEGRAVEELVVDKTRRRPPELKVKRKRLDNSSKPKRTGRLQIISETMERLSLKSPTKRSKSKPRKKQEKKTEGKGKGGEKGECGRQGKGAKGSGKSESNFLYCGGAVGV